jgi:hypothetical protein
MVNQHPAFPGIYELICHQVPRFIHWRIRHQVAGFPCSNFLGSKFPVEYSTQMH